MSIAVRPARERDLPAVAALDGDCSPVYRDVAGYARLLAAGGWLLLVPAAAGIAGFAAWARLPEAAELHNLAVAPPWRRRGVARALLQASLRQLAAAAVPRLLLEVRAGNTPALALYRALGFVEDGRRRGYYGAAAGAAAEDALLMSRTLPAAGP